MSLVKIKNRSSERRCNWAGSFGCKSPLDDLYLVFVDSNGNYIYYYHLLTENPFVPGFGKGNCKIPKEFGTEKHLGRSYNCGGIQKFEVKKGEIIGFVGATGSQKWDAHISLGIEVSKSDPRFNGEAGMVVPANNFIWENYPTDDPMKYLLPIAPN